ncbi:alkylhydroperoxidase AhpD family core domain protein [Anoxybacillus sp. B7M1]|jgi:AhpD family alkylhydroperoxidase|uniref:carboxymuconolactone decarboxylase family protein n=1 Tax=unclassified Anoxybacillus TaxID=2639704 RepID=UPI0005CD43E2|nr:MULTISPECIES: carboxymuconolactone decarboxylase family protein [unclassified Anoxybacillus]ANB57237.1 alkylhydroperoxidase AhpD family core domain protein [Anoxybacillus sp. B2M1]ANB62981.1 alkylhydroperoxidase AhpD family core domain protein [Anoxybacillus sp. B7M1]
MNQPTHSSTEAALQHYKEGLGAFTQKIPAVAEKFNAFTEACFQEGALSQKEKQLIALGISLATQDEYCTIYHTKGCIDQGATEQEILEACGVAVAFAGGAAMSQAVTLVQECIAELTTKH